MGLPARLCHLPSGLCRCLQVICDLQLSLGTILIDHAVQLAPMTTHMFVVEN